MCTRSQDVEPFLSRVRDPALRHSLAYGVGLLTETQQPAEQAVVNLLFESGAIQVRGPCVHVVGDVTLQQPAEQAYVSMLFELGAVQVRGP